MSERIRNIFYTRIKNEFYEYMKKDLLKDWEVILASRITMEIFDECESEIENYVNNNYIKIENMDHHIDRIVKSILIPYSKNIRI